ncbi:hypothetical protein SLE2022_232230 [Rubroshorea leprosula]
MWAAVRSRPRYVSSSELSPSSPLANRVWKLGFSVSNQRFSSSSQDSSRKEFLNLQEIEKVLNDVKADDVTVIPVDKPCDWADCMVIVIGRSTWHVKKIAQALIYQGNRQENGLLLVIDSGRVMVHALDEKARAYYNLENLRTAKTTQKELTEELGKALAKVRRINNSKKPAQRSA